MSTLCFTPRDYQDDCHEAIVAAFDTHQSVLVEMATGMGKTEIFVRLARDWLRGRVMIIAHTKELVAQSAQNVQERTGWMPEVEQGGLYANESEWGRSEIVVASKASLHANRLTPDRFKDIGLLIIDEAHRAAANDRSYQDIITHLREKNPDLKVLGVTATAKRHDKSAMSQVFETCCYQLGIRESIDLGWLVPNETNCVRIQSMDFSEVKITRKGDFQENQLAEIIEQDETLHEIAGVTMQEGGDRLKTLVFCASVNAAESLCGLLNNGKYNGRAGWVCGDERRVSKEERAKVLAQFKTGELNILCNVAVLTEGWNEPTVEHIVMARPTKSLPFYIQCLGRGTRPLPGVVDFPGSTPELRKAAIAASAKPCLRITDLVDASLRHYIVTSSDVLTGELDARVLERTKENILAGQGRANIDAEAERAKIEIDEEDRLQRERERVERDAAREAEAKRRASLYGKVEYAKIEVDPFGGSRSYGGKASASKGVAMLFGKYKGVKLEHVPTDYLRWFDVKMEKLKPWFKAAIQAEIRRRNKPLGTRPPMSEVELFPQQSVAERHCTPQQAALLARYGYSTNATHQQAVMYIREINRKLSQGEVSHAS